MTFQIIFEHENFFKAILTMNVCYNKEKKLVTDEWPQLEINCPKQIKKHSLSFFFPFSVIGSIYKQSLPNSYIYTSINSSS